MMLDKECIGFNIAGSSCDTGDFKFRVELTA
jgi:hypothetical protein